MTARTAVGATDLAGPRRKVLDPIDATREPHAAHLAARPAAPVRTDRPADRSSSPSRRSPASASWWPYRRSHRPARSTTHPGRCRLRHRAAPPTRRTPATSPAASSRSTTTPRPPAGACPRRRASATAGPGAATATTVRRRSPAWEVDLHRRQHRRRRPASRAGTLETPRDAQALFEGFLDEITANGYRVRDASGYSFRCTAGSGGWNCPSGDPDDLSNHAWGLAIDMNSGDQPDPQLLRRSTGSHRLPDPDRDRLPAVGDPDRREVGPLLGRVRLELRLPHRSTRSAPSCRATHPTSSSAARPSRRQRSPRSTSATTPTRSAAPSSTTPAPRSSSCSRSRPVRGPACGCRCDLDAARRAPSPR